MNLRITPRFSVQPQQMKTNSTPVKHTNQKLTFTGINLQSLDKECAEFLKQTEKVTDLGTAIDMAMSFYHTNFRNLLKTNDKISNEDITHIIGNGLQVEVGSADYAIRHGLNKPEQAKTFVNKTLTIIERGVNECYDGDFKLTCIHKGE